MNQIVSFKSFLIGLVMDRTKYWTTRIETPFRRKLKVGDIMYIYTGIRTKDAKKWGEAIIVRRFRHFQKWLIDRYEKLQSPIPGVLLHDFIIAEGFTNKEEYINYFTQKQYKNKRLLSYQFELQPNLSIETI